MEMIEAASATATVAAGPPPDQLADVLRRLRRSLRRRVRETGDFLPPLQEAQLELMRLLRDQPGIRVQQAAATLRLRPNTVSTLVAGLVRQDLVTRSTDPGDGRVVRLDLTEAARHRMARRRDHHHAVLGDALAHLDGADRDSVATALGALRRLATLLEEGDR